MQVFKRPQFLLDLAEELTWLRDHAGAEVAEAWYQSLEATLHWLQRNPFAGRVRKDLSPPGIRSWRLSGFSRWLIFYTVDHERLVLLRLRQGMMNLALLKMES